jgi:two-component system sensor histidine kinase/response regulator
LQQAEDYCHALKGVIGNIGAMALLGAVADIDAELKQGHPPTAAALDTMQVLLQDVMRDIDHLTMSSGLATAPVVVLLDPGQLRERLERLKEALDYDLGNAEPLLAQLRAGVSGTPLEADMAAIAAKVDVFDIDAAQRLRTQLHERLGP